MPGECLGEHAPHQRMLVGVVDLGAAEPPRDPRDRDTLRIARRPVLEREIASGPTMTLYNPHLTPKQELIETFVVRQRSNASGSGSRAHAR